MIVTFVIGPLPLQGSTPQRNRLRPSSPLLNFRLTALLQGGSFPFHKDLVPPVSLPISLPLLLPRYPSPLLTYTQWPPEAFPRLCAAQWPASWRRLLKSAPSLLPPVPSVLSLLAQLLPLPSSRPVVSRPWTLQATKSRSGVSCLRSMSELAQSHDADVCFSCIEREDWPKEKLLVSLLYLRTSR